jgi:hypothetical protein
VQTRLHEVSAAKRVGRDRYMIANDGSYELREYDARGQLVRSVGGGGEGPGEFRSIDALLPAADTVIAFDRQLRRFSRFSPTGQFLSSITLEAAGAGLACSPPYCGWRVHRGLDDLHGSDPSS